MNFDKVDRLDFLPENGISEAPGTLTENLTTAFNTFLFKEGAGSASQVFTMVEVWRPIVDALKENGANFANPGFYKDSYEGIMYDQKTQDIYSYIEQNKDNLPADLTSLNPESINQLARTFIADKDAQLAEVTRTSPGTGPAIARFAGGMASGVLDPVSVLSGPFGGFSKSLWKNVAQNTIINAGAGAVTEVAVKEWYEELGLDYTYADFVRNVSMNAAFGAAIPLGAAGVKITAQQAKKGFDVLKNKMQTPLSTENQALVDVLDSQADIELSNPLEAPDSNAAQFEHESRLREAEISATNNQAPNMPDQPSLDVKTDLENGGSFQEFTPTDIAVDARTFQFKEGGDEFGVTERLQGVTTWDKYKAGFVTVYEYADGRLAIADGHQRLGLAKRIMSQDPSQDVKIIGYKLREVDGISPAEARVIAAMKNIAEGTGTSIDAAKVLRVDPSRLSELPPRSELVRQARDMMALSDQAFGAIVNGVVPANYGAIVGRLIDDPGLQDAAIQVLAKADPSNAFQAESIVRQVRESGAEQVEQISLFGEELVTESFYVERAKILDRAYKELRRDKAAFETLVRNSERLEAEGNVLVKDANERKAATDAQTIALLQTLANRKGPLSDALNEAARTARDTNSYVSATGGFLDAVRGSIESGDFDRLSTGDIGRSVDGPAQITRSEVEREPALEGFDEPTGIAAERQANQLVRDMFGAEEVAPAAPVRSFDEIEADLKERQPVKAVEDIYEIAEESQSYIAKIGASIEKDLGVSFKNPGLKKIETTREKMLRKNYSSSNQITDISRGGFVINKAEDADAIVARFGQDAEILDEGWNFTPAGYFDRKVLVRTPNGIISEIQIWSPKVLAAKQKTGHKLYKKMRKSKDPAEVEALSLQMRELYANALKNEDQSFRSLSGIDNLPKVASNADINAASSGITRPVSKTSGPSTGVQAPPGSRIATASAGEMEIAGRPSQLTNIIEDTSDPNLDITLDDVNTGNLFDDMDLEVPLGERFNPDTGEVEASTMKLGDLKAVMDQEDAMIKRLEFCTI
tara:strand:+ start:2505 stop:5624 length:3120 start_codon:yes stop_codon:yes gene_type:complete